MYTLDFCSVRELKEFLEEKNFESGSPEEYNKWLERFYEEGNAFSVRGEEYDYWSCWELV